MRIPGRTRIRVMSVEKKLVQSVTWKNINEQLSAEGEK